MFTCLRRFRRRSSLRRLLKVSAAALACTAWGLPPAFAAVPGPAPSAQVSPAAPDPHSFSRPGEIAVSHLDLDLTVDFSARRLIGSATLTLDHRDPAATVLHLDARGLEISSVHLDGAKEATPFHLAAAVPILGQDLEIVVLPSTRKVKIDYRTQPEAAALQWLAPAQTSGGKQPLLFSQSEAILARTWVPCQDSPGVRMTYSATLHVPKGLLALMSATNPQARNSSGVYRFEMTKPIPSYLLAMAVGDLEFRPVGARSGIYAEPSVAAKAAWELADTEKMIAAAENLYGPYRWERYDLLILPPSFPYGGMENPRLTFATPTILAGDRSLVSLVAHELAHSWSGNLVTNATWNDFWLNEGFTTYFETRIMEAVYGRDYSEMQAQLSKRDLEAYVHEVGKDSRDTWLYGNLTGADPDDAPPAIAYDKGYFFIRNLEETVGRARWDAFLRDYFDAHAFQSMDTTRFVDWLNEKLLAGDPDATAKARVQEWIYGPGIPAGAADPKSPAFARVDQELARFAAGTPAAALVTTGWVTQQWQNFLRKLPRDADAKQLADLDSAFHFSASGNAEILADWFQHAIAMKYEPAYPALERFLGSVGRRKFVVPLYAALARTPDGLNFAKVVFARARAGYHPLTQGSVDAILNAKR